jgi:urea transport system ATP-binding protein
MALLEVKDLTTVVSGYTILNQLNFSVAENELRVLLGPNGAGKTTLMAMITGQFKPTSGTIVFNGEDITGKSPDRIALAGISRKFQVPNMYETLSVYDNIMISLQGDRKVFKYMFKSVSAAENDRIWEILDFIELSDKANDPADTLSHGERQWLELGMLVAASPKLQAHRRPHPAHRHEPHRAPRRARHGRGAPDRQECDGDASGPGSGRRTPRRGGGERDGEVGLSRQGRDALMLTVTNVDTFYGTSHILHQVSLIVGDGELVAVLGRNGAGKTTLLRSITGVNPPKGGTIELNGADITREKSHKRTHLGISYVPQGRQIIPDLTVAENIGVALLGKGGSDIRVPGFVYDWFPALKPLASRKGGVLSGGQQQQLAIARALVQEPKLLLLDEPTEGLQPSVVEEIQSIIKRILAERKCSVLLVEQRLDFVRDITQRFAILDTGRIVAQGDVAQLTDAVVKQHLQV